MIGVILLMGLVTKNAILLVDYTNTLRAEGMDRHTAMITANRVRLRPILMTTISIVAGMLPIATSLSNGGFRQPMGIAVMGGLVTSTVLSLVVVPAVFTYVDDVALWMGRQRKRFSRNLPTQA